MSLRLAHQHVCVLRRRLDHFDLTLIDQVLHFSSTYLPPSATQIRQWLEDHRIGDRPHEPRVATTRRGDQAALFQPRHLSLDRGDRRSSFLGDLAQ